MDACSRRLLEFAVERSMFSWGVQSKRPTPMNRERALNLQRPTPNQERERVRGIEPPCAAWEAAVLPLNYTRVLEK